MAGVASELALKCGPENGGSVPALALHSTVVDHFLVCLPSLTYVLCGQKLCLPYCYTPPPKTVLDTLW